MSLKDYEHWNEDAYYMWYHEEGKHSYEPEYCDQCGGSHSSFSCEGWEDEE